jgi:hypothetical protein
MPSTKELSCSMSIQCNAACPRFDIAGSQSARDSRAFDSSAPIPFGSARSPDAAWSVKSRTPSHGTASCLPLLRLSTQPGCAEASASDKRRELHATMQCSHKRDCLPPQARSVIGNAALYQEIGMGSPLHGKRWLGSHPKQEQCTCGLLNKTRIRAVNTAQIRTEIID